MKQYLIAALAVAAVAVAVTGCNKSGNAAASASSAKASASAFATSSAGQADKAQAMALYNKCIASQWTTPIGEAKYFRYLVATPASKYATEGVTARDNLGKCAGVPKDQRTPFGNEVLSTLETATANQLVKHQKGAIVSWAEVTMPQLVAKYQNKK